jgi:arylsulfatase A-like enzyme
MRLPLLVHAFFLALPAACGESPRPPTRVADEWPLAVEFPHGPEPRYERVVLVTIDTLRADHVSAYGYRRRTTPFLDSLAQRGVLFGRASAVISHTAPSHSSMLTGLPPLVHGVLHNGYQMDENAVDLARVFAAAGFETAACVNTEFLQGVARSFQSVHATTERGEEVVKQARAWLTEERRGERFFLWVHLFDPHRWKGFAVEIEAERLFRGKTPPDFEGYLMDLHGLSRLGTEGLLSQRWDTEVGKLVELESVAQYLRFVEAYDTLIHYADERLRSLYEAVEELKLPGPTLWIVTADHGEGLGSHGMAGHGGHIYQEQLAVPLVVHASDGSLAPRRVEALTTHLDLFPTLVETLGGSVSGSAGLLEGRSLWPLIRGERVDWSKRIVFAQRKPTGETLYSLRSERFKLLHSQSNADELYDLAADPRELDNRFEAELPERTALERELEQRLRLFEANAQGGEEQEIPEEWMGELRDLGYVR